MLKDNDVEMHDSWEEFLSQKGKLYEKSEHATKCPW